MQTVKSEIGLWVILFLVTAGCAPDKNSTQAVLEEAQMALDKGDCQKAIDGFTEVFNRDPGDTGVRINLAAAYACRAGFNPTALIRVSADYASSLNAAQFSLFKVVADNAAKLISSSWDPDTKSAISYLTYPPGQEPPNTATASCQLVPYGLSQDAAFNLTVVETVRAVMAVMAYTNYVAGTGASATSIDRLTPTDLDTIQAIMNEADTSLSCTGTFYPNQTIVAPDVKNTLHDLNAGINDVNCAPGASALDTCHTDTLTIQDVKNYLDQQGIPYQ
ncbi:MAG: hypothetical protein HY204_00175 [Nitrospirae bacterium]|nr:hypothetical protein [Nitrospirota bacterium]